MTHRFTGKAKRKTGDALLEWYDCMVILTMSFGATWLNAWIWNPDLSSGTVWFIGTTIGFAIVINRITAKEEN